MINDINCLNDKTTEKINTEDARSFMEINSETFIPDRFEIPRRNAKYVIETSVGPFDRPEIVLKAQQIQGRCYVEYGYVKEDALTDDGRLVSELDSARDDDGKTVVNYLVVHEIGKTIDEAGATMRVIDVGEHGTVEDLPAYKYFKDAFSPEVKMKLENIIDLYGPRSIRELAALGVTNQRNVFGSYELMRAVMQNSLIKEASSGYREKYLAALTELSLAPVIRFAGKGAIEILGEPVRVHADDPRQKEVYITPVLIDPNKALEGFIDEIESAEKNADIVSLVQKINFLTDGLSREQFSRRVALFLDKIA